MMNEKKKKVLVLCNIGARDVFLQGQKIAPPRSEGRRLLAAFETASPALTLPIIEPSLTYIVNTLAPEREIHFRCFATDQSDENFRHKDTLFFADLVVEKLREIFGDEGLECQSILVKDTNPSLYDEAVEAFQETLRKVYDPVYERVFIIITGGTPAFNTALFLQGFRFFGEKLQVVYKPEHAEPLLLRVDQQIRQTFDESTAAALLDRYDFANAARYLENLKIDPGLRCLNAYAAQRLHFNFAAAQQSLHQALQTGSAAVRQFINQSLRHGLDQILGEGTPSKTRLLLLLQELAWNAKIAFRQARYADFLGRVYRFQEAGLRFLVEDVFQLPTDLNKNHEQATLDNWERGIRSDADLLAYLEKQKEGDRKLDWMRISRPVYKALLSYAIRQEADSSAVKLYIQKDKEKNYYGSVFDRLNKLDPWVELRHRTILGHDFNGVSKEIIEQRAPKDLKGSLPSALLEIARMLYAATLGRPPVNPYHVLVDMIKEQMKRE